MFEIKTHRLKDVDFFETKKMSGQITPKAIVIHYTAGLSFENDLRILTVGKNKASAHALIGRQGDVAQIVPFNFKAWHAGPSRYKGFHGLNSHSVGIELENIGYLKSGPNNTYVDYYKNVYTEDDIKQRGWELEKHRHKIVGGSEYWWPVFTKVQLDLCEHMCLALIDYYPSIKYILSHEEIDTRGWKTDPGPAFPMQRFTDLLSQDVEEEDDEQIVTVSGLNVRQGPGTSHEILTELDKGQHVNVRDLEGDWALIEWWVNGVERSGHVHERYIRPR